MDHSKYYLKLAQNSKGSDTVARRTRTNVSETPVMRPALTPEAKENQMISLAMHCAEKQMREGTASSQVITHFLKLGTGELREALGGGEALGGFLAHGVGRSLDGRQRDRAAAAALDAGE